LTLGFENILGLTFDVEDGKGGVLTDDLMKLIIDLRNSARAERNFAVADKIRDWLKEAGVILEDGKEGTRWSVSV